MQDYKDIIGLIRKKDPAGLEVLYNEYGSRFYDYATRRWELTEDDAWEVVYKTLETLVLKLDNYRFELKALFEAFLFKVLLNFIREYYRAKRSRNIAELELVDLYDEEQTPHHISKQVSKNAFAEYYKTELIESPDLLLLNDALQRLEQADQDILLLRAQNYSYDEIAQLLGIANNQLKVKHHRAKQKLITIINDLQKK